MFVFIFKQFFIIACKYDAKNEVASMNCPIERTFNFHTCCLYSRNVICFIFFFEKNYTNYLNRLQRPCKQKAKNLNRTHFIRNWS